MTETQPDWQRARGRKYFSGEVGLARSQRACRNKIRRRSRIRVWTTRGDKQRRGSRASTLEPGLSLDPAPLWTSSPALTERKAWGSWEFTVPHCTLMT